MGPLRRHRILGSDSGDSDSDSDYEPAAKDRSWKCGPRGGGSAALRAVAPLKTTGLSDGDEEFPAKVRPRNVSNRRRAAPSYPSRTPSDNPHGQASFESASVSKRKEPEAEDENVVNFCSKSDPPEEEAEGEADEE